MLAFLFINGMMCMLKQFSEVIYKLKQQMIINVHVYTRSTVTRQIVYRFQMIEEKIIK